MDRNQNPASFGRVADDGTVYVKTKDGERSVGQVPDASPEEAMAFFVRRYEALQVEVNLLANRVEAGSISPDEARKTIDSLRTNIAEANAVGDLAALDEELDQIIPAVEKLAAERKAAREAELAQVLELKENIVAEAERLSESTQWRQTNDRYHNLLAEWKVLPRLPRGGDNDLWKRFSGARSTFTKRRRAHFSQQAEQREEARKIKEGLIVEAEELSDSTDWGRTSGEYRDLLARWKAAGPAPRSVENKLWEQFRAAQDKFFAARNEANAEIEAKQQENLVAKEQLLDEAEKAILPVENIDSAKQAYREFLNKYNEYGHVPRKAIKQVDSRLRALESAIRNAEQAEWQRTDPEARRRAEDTVNMFAAHIKKLEENLAKAQAKGNDKAVKQAEESIASYRELLAQAEKTLADFSR